MTNDDEDLLHTYKGYLEIDRDALDIEIPRQPLLLFNISEVIIRLREDLDFYKAEINKVVARERLKLLDDPAKRSLSEAKTLALVKGAHSYIEATADLNIARADLALWESMYDAFKERSSMLRKLADIYVANYYQTTNVGHTSDQKRSRRNSRTNV